MKKREGFLLIAFILIICGSLISSEINSTNYKVVTPTISNGGDNISSSNYIVNAMVGIISGITDSASYKNIVGFYLGGDSSAPTITINTPLNTSYKSIIVFNVTATDISGVDTCIYSLDGSTNKSMTNLTSSQWTATNSSMTEGIHTVIFYCNDTEGIIGDKNVTFTVDITLPSVTINTPLNITYANTTIIFNVTATDINIVNACVYSLDNTANKSMTNITASEWNATNSSMTQVTHNVKFYCNDTAGNINGSESVTFLVDTSIPQIEFVPPTPNNLDLFNENYTYVNVSTSDANNHSAFVDWNNSLVGWWRMDAYNSTGIYDNSSYGNFAVFDGVSASNITTGIRGKGIEFDGSNDYVSINPTDNLILNQGGTISSWIKIAKLGSSYSNTIFMKGDSAGWADLHIELFELTGTDQICLSLSNGSSYLGASCPKSSTLLENTWYHIAASWNSTTKCVFTNGLQSECVQSTIMPENTLTNTVIQLGMTYNSNYPFNGSIDDVMIFNRALSTQEIQALYNAGSYRLYNNFTNLTDGDYTFKAYAYDEAGNMNFTETRTITVDTIAPNVTINLPQNTTYISATTIFNATATDTNGVSACVYSLDNALNKSMINTFGNEWNATNLSMTEGIHIVKFYCNDTAGNINGSESRIFTVNLPPTMVTVKINSTTNTSTENIKGYCNATDGDGDDLAYQYQWYNGSTVYFNGTLFKEGTISAGLFHACGIRANDSRVLCWGRGDWGNLGDGEITNNLNPNVTTDISPYASVSAGRAYTCGIRANDSRVLCWGYCDLGSCGDGNTSAHNVLNPNVTTDISAYTNIDAEQYHTCGIRANDSRVLCWGRGDWGNLGDGQTTNNPNPNITTDSSAYSSISAGTYHTCGIRTNDSRVLCWGYGNDGELGDGSTSAHNVGNPNVTTDTLYYKSISAGSQYTCGIRANDSRVLCWGLGSTGQLGDGSTGSHTIGNPNITTDTSGYKKVTAHYTHTCGIRANDSRVLCWGDSVNGALGDGQTTTDKGNPILTTDASAYIEIVSGQYYTCGIRANDSRVLCWGYGESGERGDGQITADQPNPKVTTDTSPYGRGFSSGNETLVSILGNAFLNIGETWSFGCRAYDFTGYSSWMNSSGITVLSSNDVPNDPSPNLVSVDGTNKTLSNLNCSAIISDPDGDTLDVSVRWYKNGGLNQTIDYNNSYADGTTFSAILDDGNTTKLENWTCQIRLYDGALYSDWGVSSNLTILNTLPTVNLVSPNNYNTTTNRTPQFSWSGQDDDSDSLTYDLNLTCYSTLGGGCIQYDRYISGISATSYIITQYLEALSDNDYYYNWSVKASDDSGVTYGNYALPKRRIDINAELIITLINDTVSFGTLQFQGTANTSTNSPWPFLLQNDGNCMLNISTNATNLWNSIVNPNNYYQFKVDNQTGEKGSFNSQLSNISWSQMPATTGMMIVQLNWSDTNDTAEVDILVEVPTDEGSGDRSSNIVFTAELGE
ncbi:MAG TPA: LamG-like jellyroll fold domain-containing protein [Candidatus Nanoarchaeia archaeon]|nr:hypothetical protein [uncultured archaeon]AQS29566.1 hypothetical protein [uncultured archaeon]HLD55039.1 LamG-like jellyroll fold domain-containing protein [Candidatus Nanoarchaeia archaeon]